MKKSDEKRKGKKRCDLCDAPMSPLAMQCAACGKWHAPVTAPEGGDGTVLLDAAEIAPLERIATGPWDPCFGDGFVKGSVVLIGGSPGAGKSTLSLQLSDAVARVTGHEVLYVAAEERVGEIRARATRLELEHLGRMRMVPIVDGFTGDLGDTILARNPAAVVVDSVAALSGHDPAEAVKTAEKLKDYAAALNAPVLLIDHVTKGDDFAGLMTLQHAVDVLVTLYPYVDGEPGRELSSLKNRYAATTSVCFQMTEYGLGRCAGCAYCAKNEPAEDS